MQTREEHTLDKSTWGPGPWQDEPDLKQWSDAKTGLPCLAIRHDRYGNWCGYVGVTPTHPLFGKSHKEINYNVHGGLTFSGPRKGAIYHIPDIREPEPLYWFGFDCYHSQDFAPGHTARLHTLGIPVFESPIKDVYRTLAFVERECARLARQLAKKITKKG